jgi:hypothetical protein
MKRLDRLAAVLIGLAALAVGPAAHSQSKPADTVRYTVKTGDTLLGLTAQYLTGSNAFQKLVAANDVPDPERIYPGRVILVPVNLMRSTPLQAAVASFKGAVLVGEAGNLGLPRVGMGLRPGHVVQTGVDGFVTIALSNGSRMTLPTKSRVRIVQMRQFLLTKSADLDFFVESGRTEMSVTPSRDSNNLFRLRTPIAVSAVRGTKFRIGYDGQAQPSLTEVLDGNVTVDGPSAATATALVPAGFGAAASATGDVGTEALLPPPAIIGADKLWRKKTLDFDLVPVPTARGYRLQLATDEDFQNMVAEARSASPRLTIGSVASGRYFARAMAVAPSGLEGLSTTYSIRREIAPLIGSVNLLDRGRYQFQWETDGAAEPLFRLQLFAKANSTVPIIDETGLTTYSMIVDGLSPGDYSWRVGMRRVSGNGTDEFWTDAEMLTIPSREK